MNTINYGRRSEDHIDLNGRINLSREQHQSLVELSPEPIIVYCDQSIVYINPAGVTMIGAQHKAEVIGKDIGDFLHPDHMNNIIAESKQFLKVGKPSELFERKLIRFDGVTITAEVRAIPLVYKGKPAIQFLCKNITEQRKIEQSLRDSEQKYRHMVQMSPQATVIHTDDLISYVNDAAMKLLQAQNEDQIVGESIYKFIHSDYHDTIKKRILDIQSSKEPIDFFTYKLIAFDGGVFEVESSSIVLQNSNGETYIQSVLIDITDKRKEEILLRESARTYERLIEFLPEPIIVTDNGIIIYMNVSAEKLVKSEFPKQLIGKSFIDIIHPFDRERTQSIISEVMLTDARSPFTDRKLICGNGEYIDVEVSSIRIHNFMGKTVVLSVIRDLTESKHSQEILVKSEKLSVIGQLAAGVAHEIRNPLTVLKGFTQLLQKELGSKHSYLTTMLSELDRINDIVNEFMTLAKPQFVQFHSNYIYNILNSVISILETQAILVNVNIKISYVGQIPLIYCEENQLKQVFINVIKNSIEAMPFGGEIDIVVELINRNQLLIRIHDQGPGIPQEIIRRIGEPFYTTKENGTGLGLMVCQRIIEAHHGTLHISSELGLGATIDILLPVE
ncbi:MAG: PAS domain S-box protein [Paenibacillaceae bacterium]